MWKLSISMLFLMVPPIFAQLEPHTLTISASHSTPLQPDQVVFGLSVTSGATISLDQVVGALTGLGITSTNLTGISNNSTPPTVQWNFTLSVPLSSLTITLGSLTKLQLNIGQNNSGLILTFTVEGTQVSQQLQQSQTCSNSDLVVDATAQGQKLAAAAGLTLGPVRALSKGSPIQNENTGIFGNVVAVAQLVPANFLFGALTSPVTCSLNVEFRLLP
jgi:hypothetical protein